MLVGGHQSQDTRSIKNKDDVVKEVDEGAEEVVIDEEE